MACATDFYRCGCGAIVKCRTTCTQCFPAKRAAAEARARAEFSARKEQADRERRALQERKQAEARSVTQTLAGQTAPFGEPPVCCECLKPMNNYTASTFNEYKCCPACCREDRWETTVSRQAAKAAVAKRVMQERAAEFSDIAQRMNAAFAEATNPELSNYSRENAIRCYCIALRERLDGEGMTPQQQDGIVAQHTQLIIRQLQANRVSKGLNDAREARGMSRLDTLAELAERAQQANQGALAAAMAQQQQAQADLSMQGMSSISNYGGQGVAEAERRAKSGWAI